MVFESLIREKNIQLTDVQVQIVNYILDHFDEAIFLNASRIARKVGVSEASVVRLAQKLGFEGYTALQRKLQKHFQNNLTTVTRITKSTREAKDDGDILVKVIQEDIGNLTETLRELSPETFCQAVSEMWSARRVFVVGFKEAHAPAMVLANSLSYFMDNVFLLDPKIGQIWDKIFDIGPDDLVVGISVPRYMRITVEILRYSYEKGARVGAITNSAISPLTAYTHWILPARARLDSFIESFTAPMSLVNAIITALSVKDPEKTLDILKAREELWEQKRLYASYPIQESD